MAHVGPLTLNDLIGNLAKDSTHFIIFFLYDLWTRIGS